MHLKYLPHKSLNFPFKSKVNHYRGRKYSYNLLIVNILVPVINHMYPAWSFQAEHCLMEHVNRVPVSSQDDIVWFFNTLATMKRTMKIVILDGYTLNPGDLSWEGFEKLGDLTVYDRTPGDSWLERAANAEALITNKTALTGKVISQLKNARYIGVLATGYNIVDTEAARRRGIPVTNVPHYATESVAQMVFAHILNLAQHVAEHSISVKEGKWSRSQDFCFWDYPLTELSGLTIGIIGAGSTGQATARIAMSFGMKVISYDINTPEKILPGIEMASLERVLAQSDVVSLHCPLTPENINLINAEKLSMMKNTAFLINTGRGPLIDENALAECLNSGRLAGAGLDVLSKEPPDPNNPLFKASNCHITPHIAWASKSARKRLMDVAVNNLKSFIEGQPVNVVNAL